MKRRNALKKLGAGLSAGLVFPWLPGCSGDDPVPASGYKGTVAVIGGGAAGLYAADYLLAKGINVIVYEASNRLGGRVRTLRPNDQTGGGLWFNERSRFSSDFPIELGSDRIYGADSIWARFVGQEKFSTQPLDLEAQNRYWLGGNLLSVDAAMAVPEFQQALSFANSLATQGNSGGSVHDAILSSGISTEMLPLLYGRIGNRYGTSNERLGMLGLSQETALKPPDTSNLLLTNNAMADVLIERFIRASERAQLNTVITNVNYQGDRILLTGEVTTGGASQPFSTEVDKVILTIPVSVIKSGDITFTPDLPASRKSALDHIGMDTALRIVLDFRRNFWGSGFRTIFGGEIPEYFNAGEGRSTVARSLQMTISGVKAEQLSDLGYDSIPIILEELDRMFDNQASLDMRRDAVEDKYVAAIQDWGKEPYIKGCRSYLKPGGTIEHRRELSRPIQNKLYFAGEATDFSGEAGTVNGALHSAERVGQEILEAVKG